MDNSENAPDAWAPEETPAAVTPPHIEAPVAAPASADEAIAMAATSVEAAATAVPAAAASTPSVAPADARKIFEAPVKSITELQTKVRSMFEKGISETHANFNKAKSAADEANSALEASFTTAKTGVIAINVKALDALRASADANFDFVKSVLGVKSVSEYVTLHAEFARKQLETMTGQSKEIAALAQKVATQSVEPIKAQVAKTFKVAV